MVYVVRQYPVVRGILVLELISSYTLYILFFNIFKMAEEKKAKKVYTLEEIRFNEENKSMAILACIPIVGLILLFTEKEDLFVRYNGAQYTVLTGMQLVLSIIPVLGWALAPLFSMLSIVLIVVGMIKTSQGERFDIPMVSDWALKLMASI